MKLIALIKHNFLRQGSLADQNQDEMKEKGKISKCDLEGTFFISVLLPLLAKTQSDFHQSRWIIL